MARRLVVEDVTVFGEQLSELHIETLTTELDEDMQGDYQRALDLYETAKSSLEAATTVEDVADVDTLLTDGRFHLACILARRDGVELPTRRESCFFNPQHGPGVTDVTWAPPNGVARTVAVCGSDARRLEAGEAPIVRLVRVGDRYVNWHEADNQRGLLTATFGTEAVAGVPKYIMLEADMARTRSQMPGGIGSI